MEFVRQATRQDALELAPLLRQADIMEIEAASGLSPEAALLHGVECGRPTLSFVDPKGGLAGMFGVTPTDDPLVGAVWMLSSGAIERYPIHFLRRCRPWVDKFHEAYPVLMNYVDQRNDVHIRWLKWMGFTFVRLVPYGVNQLPFYEIVRVKTPCALRK